MNDYPIEVGRAIPAAVRSAWGPTGAPAFRVHLSRSILNTHGGPERDAALVELID